MLELWAIRVFHRVSTLEVVIICLEIQDTYRETN